MICKISPEEGMALWNWTNLLSYWICWAGEYMHIMWNTTVILSMNWIYLY